MAICFFEKLKLKKFGNFRVCENAGMFQVYDEFWKTLKSLKILIDFKLVKCENALKFWNILQV
jgi:hypothetical protein